MINKAVQFDHDTNVGNIKPRRDTQHRAAPFLYLLTMKKIYVSIPITGKVYEEQKAKAEAVKKELQAKGNEVITPFEICPEQGKTDAYYMGKCIEALLECDVIYMCDGWKQSKGCRTEHFAALEYGLIVGW